MPSILQSSDNIGVHPILISDGRVHAAVVSDLPLLHHLDPLRQKGLHLTRRETSRQAVPSASRCVWNVARLHVIDNERVTALRL